MSILLIRSLSFLIIGLCVQLTHMPAHAQDAAQKAPATKATALTVPEAFERAQQKDVVLVDVREPQEWLGGVAANAQGEVMAKLVPMSKLNERYQEIPNDPNQQVIIICRTQNRSSEVAKQLMAKGYTNVSYVNGGMKEWAERKLPTAAPPK